MSSNCPSVRFSQFHDEWQNRRVSELLLSYRLGGNYQNCAQPNQFPLLKMGNLARGYFDLNKVEYVEGEIPNDDDLVKNGDLFFNTRNTLELVGKVAVWRGELSQAYYNSNLLRLEFKNNYFFNYLFNSFQGLKKLKRIASGTTSVAAIYTRDLLNVNIKVPPSSFEQQKIADFLSAVDKKISLLKDKHTLLEQYKKGVMQKLFKQEIRFKDDSGTEFPDWQSRRFEEVFVRITRKNKEDNQNVLTISAQMGLVNQEKYFNKSVSAKDLTGYYLLENGDFAYNKSYSKGYPMGAIKRLNNYDKGVVSTLYICFRVVGEQEPLFWEQFFEAGLLNREINKIAQEGARNHGLLNVSVTEFFNDIEVPVPSRAEQRKIADFLCVLDKKLNSVKEQIELTQTFKKGLLQQMFV